MSTNTTILQGRYTSTGEDIIIPIRSGVNWFKTYNLTSIESPTSTDVQEAYWQLGFADASAICTVYTSFATTPAVTSNSLAYHNGTGGFTLIDSSSANYGVIHATVTAVSNASIPVVTNTGTNGLVAGDVVRMFNVTNALELGGIDFTVGQGTLSSTTFSLDYMVPITAGTTGSWMKVNYDPIFYPRKRYISGAVQDQTTEVTLTVKHDYKVGQAVRFNIPSAYNCPQLNGLIGNIIAVNTTYPNNSITVDIDSSNFGILDFPESSAYPFTPAEVVPVGEDTAIAEAYGQNILSDATLNTAELGMLITGGATQPGGADNDVIYWVAGSSFSVDNQ